MTKLTDENIQEMIELYQNNVSLDDLGTKFNIHSGSVRRILRNKGVFKNSIPPVSPENIQYIIESYNKGISSELIAQQLNINGSTVCRILKRNNISIRPATENKRKYKINQDFFATIDTEEKAYFLGFMYADGNVSTKKSDVKISLHEQDKDILEKFSFYIYGFNKYFKEYRTLEDDKIHTYYTISITCKKMKQDLIKLGCPPNKTFIITFPVSNIVPDHLLHHFVRGYFDGCISIEKKNIDFTSNLQFIQKLINYLDKNNIGHWKMYIDQENDQIANFQIGTFKNITDFYNLIYKDATLYLQRKYNTFQQYFQEEKNKVSKRTDKYNDINNYGTHYIFEYNGKKITTDNLKQMTQEEKDEVAQAALKFYRKNGFPYQNSTRQELIKKFNLVKNTDATSIENNKILRIDNLTGTEIFKNFSPHFFEVKYGADKNRKSMLEVFNNDELLLKVIQNRLNQNYKMCGNMLRQGISNSKLGYKASVFNTILAKFIYHKFTNPNDVVYDYSMGFGQRLIGALSLPHNLTYIGVDPYQKTVNSNQNIYDFYNTNNMLENKQVKLYCMGSEEYQGQKNSVKLAFSSPPYFNLETYVNEESQAYNKNYDYFINVYWKKTVKNIDEMLVSDGYFILNIKDKYGKYNLSKDMLNLCQEYGFTVIDTYQILLSKNTKFANKQGIPKYEPIYVMQKL